ncbi:MAG: lactate dehydrogenase, partial [Nitrosopumilaceae archaeon]|nr:lactate dehydrogenase [Nitrosopumilaceae archaeon]NIU87609.1 lactate dehydrogenase [Nitrosopumilaceae archaeon]NIV66041.1 lactate dehydrogenase [Nitrosopumilaceae archaeon]NIX61861.1 lactate dehydrogenase [Nitrosopumilaceae archaeon]
MISIIGSGNVGSAIAFLIASQGLDDITLLNRTKSKAIGESLDISNAIPERSRISISGTDDYSKIIVIAASTGIYKTNRVELLKSQISMIKKIAKNIRDVNPRCVFLLVSNP